MDPEEETADVSRDVAEETQENAQETSREADYLEFRETLRELVEVVNELRGMIGGAVETINSVAVDNGAQITDVDEVEAADNGAIEVTEEIQDPRKRDYTI